MPGSEERWSAQDAQKGEEVKAIANDLTIGRQIIDQLVKAFQTAVDECNWLNTRLLVRFGFSFRPSWPSLADRRLGGIVLLRFKLSLILPRRVLSLLLRSWPFYRA